MASCVPIAVKSMAKKKGSQAKTCNPLFLLLISGADCRFRTGHLMITNRWDFSFLLFPFLVENILPHRGNGRFLPFWHSLNLPILSLSLLESAYTVPTWRLHEGEQTGGEGQFHG